jgi:hydroxymethylpyrimidine pyrophosphatase-like HAD family hydrolase
MKLIVLDIDGVLSDGEARPFDLKLMGHLRELNRQSQTDSAIPAVTLNTGRPSPYVEAVMQSIDGWQPALFENGAGLYFPQSYRFQISPLLSSSIKTQLQELISVLDKNIVQNGKAYWQPGKTICHTLFPIPPYSITEIADEVRACLGHVSDLFAASIAAQALNIHPRNISKGTGLQWLAEHTNIQLSEMAGIGDSDSDMDFLNLLAHSAATDNATANVKAMVRYVSPYPTTEGLEDILTHWQL